MQLDLTIGESEKINLLIERNWFTGRFSLTVNDEKHTLKSPYSFTTHFNANKKSEYSFEVGEREKHIVVIQHIRPRFFVGFRKQEFNVIVDRELCKSFKG